MGNCGCILGSERGEICGTQNRRGGQRNGLLLPLHLNALLLIDDQARFPNLHQFQTHNFTGETWQPGESTNRRTGQELRGVRAPSQLISAALINWIKHFLAYIFT